MAVEAEFDLEEFAARLTHPIDVRVPEPDLAIQRRGGETVAVRAKPSGNQTVVSFGGCSAFSHIFGAPRRR